MYYHIDSIRIQLIINIENNKILVSLKNYGDFIMEHPVYIPKEIWGLNMPTLHRCLLAHIHFFTTREGNCSSSNIHLAKEMGCSEYMVTKAIKELKSEKYIRVNIKRSAEAAYQGNGVFSKRTMKSLVRTT